MLQSVTSNINTIYDLAHEVAGSGSSVDVDDDDDADEPSEPSTDEGKRWGAKEIVGCLTDFKYVGALFFLADLISVVNLVSTCFQKDIMESSVSYVSSQIELLKTHVQARSGSRLTHNTDRT